LDKLADLDIMLDDGARVDDTVVANTGATVDQSARHNHYSVPDSDPVRDAGAQVDNARPL
jgi:hypothetical protein